MKDSKTTRVLIKIVLCLLAVICALPMLLVLINSFKTHQDIVHNPLAIQFTAGLSNYVKAWTDGRFAQGLLNSVVYTGSTVLIVLVFATLAAYVIAGRKVRGTSVVLSYFLITMTMPVYLFLIPLYRVYAKMGWLGNHVAVSFILAACGLPLAISLPVSYTHLLHPHRHAHHRPHLHRPVQGGGAGGYEHQPLDRKSVV